MPFQTLQNFQMKSPLSIFFFTNLQFLFLKMAYFQLECNKVKFLDSICQKKILYILDPVLFQERDMQEFHIIHLSPHCLLYNKKLQNHIFCIYRAHLPECCLILYLCEWFSIREEISKPKIFNKIYIFAFFHLYFLVF